MNPQTIGALGSVILPTVYTLARMATKNSSPAGESPKPGVKTTEFWMTVVATLGSLASLFGGHSVTPTP